MQMQMQKIQKQLQMLMQKQEKQKQEESVEMASNAKQQGNNIMATGQHVANSSNKAKQHNNKIDAAAWSDSLCYHYKQFTIDSNSIKRTVKNGGYIFGNRVMNTYYELTVRCDNDSGGYGFYLGIADASYKNKSGFGSG